MSPTPKTTVENLKQSALAWLSARWTESNECRDCSSHVNPLDTVCPCCGVANPARVQVSPLVWITAVLTCVLVGGLVVVL